MHMQSRGYNVKELHHCVNTALYIDIAILIYILSFVLNNLKQPMFGFRFRFNISGSGEQILAHF